MTVFVLKYYSAKSKGIECVSFLNPISVVLASLVFEIYVSLHFSFVSANDKGAGVES
jgi:hypothetical protein